jgi:hypothetical protein
MAAPKSVELVFVSKLVALDRMSQIASFCVCVCVFYLLVPPLSTLYMIIKTKI